MDASDDAVEALLGEEIVPLAADIFVATFTGVGLGRERFQGRADKELRRRFGKPRDSDASHAYQAVVLQIVLIWEQALIAARSHPGVLTLLPDGARLLDSKDAAAGLKALLHRDQ